MFALLLAITLSVPSFAFAADEASESNAYSAAPARAERLIAKGKVIDPNGQPVAGVAVIIDETKTGTVTDGNGYYVIDVQRRRSPDLHLSGLQAPDGCRAQVAQPRYLHGRGYARNGCRSGRRYGSPA